MRKMDKQSDEKEENTGDSCLITPGECSEGGDAGNTTSKGRVVAAGAGGGNQENHADSTACEVNGMQTEPGSEGDKMQVSEDPKKLDIDKENETISGNEGDIKEKMKGVPASQSSTDDEDSLNKNSEKLCDVTVDNVNTEEVEKCGGQTGGGILTPVEVTTQPGEETIDSDREKERNDEELRHEMKQQGENTEDNTEGKQDDLMRSEGNVEEKRETSPHEIPSGSKGREEADGNCEEEKEKPTEGNEVPEKDNVERLVRESESEVVGKVGNKGVDSADVEGDEEEEKKQNENDLEMNRNDDAEDCHDAKIVNSKDDETDDRRKIYNSDFEDTEFEEDTEDINRYELDESEESLRLKIPDSDEEDDEEDGTNVNSCELEGGTSSSGGGGNVEENHEMHDTESEGEDQTEVLDNSTPNIDESLTNIDERIDDIGGNKDNTADGNKEETEGDCEMNRKNPNSDDLMEGIDDSLEEVQETAGVKKLYTKDSTEECINKQSEESEEEREDDSSGAVQIGRQEQGVKSPTSGTEKENKPEMQIEERREDKEGELESEVRREEHKDMVIEESQIVEERQERRIRNTSQEEMEASETLLDLTREMMSRECADKQRSKEAEENESLNGSTDEQETKTQKLEDKSHGQSNRKSAIKGRKLKKRKDVVNVQDDDEAKRDTQRTQAKVTEEIRITRKDQRKLKQKEAGMSTSEVIAAEDLQKQTSKGVTVEEEPDKFEESGVAKDVRKLSDECETNEDTEASDEVPESPPTRTSKVLLRQTERRKSPAQEVMENECTDRNSKQTGGKEVQIASTTSKSQSHVDTEAVPSDSDMTEGETSSEVREGAGTRTTQNKNVEELVHKNTPRSTLARENTHYKTGSGNKTSGKKKTLPSRKNIAKKSTSKIRPERSVLNYQQSPLSSPQQDDSDRTTHRETPTTSRRQSKEQDTEDSDDSDIVVLSENIMPSTARSRAMSSLVCNTCQALWNDDVLEAIFEGNKCVTVNSKITYGAIMCFNRYADIHYVLQKDQTVRNVLERADLGKNIGSLKITEVIDWLTHLMQHRTVTCCKVFDAVYNSKAADRLSSWVQPGTSGTPKSVSMQSKVIKTTRTKSSSILPSKVIHKATYSKQTHSNTSIKKPNKKYSANSKNTPASGKERAAESDVLAKECDASNTAPQASPIGPSDKDNPLTVNNAIKEKYGLKECRVNLGKSVLIPFSPQNVVHCSLVDSFVAKMTKRTCPEELGKGHQRKKIRDGKRSLSGEESSGTRYSSDSVREDTSEPPENEESMAEMSPSSANNCMFESEESLSEKSFDDRTSRASVHSDDTKRKTRSENSLAKCKEGKGEQNGGKEESYRKHKMKSQDRSKILRSHAHGSSKPFTTKDKCAETSMKDAQDRTPKQRPEVSRDEPEEEMIESQDTDTSDKIRRSSSSRKEKTRKADIQDTDDSTGDSVDSQNTNDTVKVSSRKRLETVSRSKRTRDSRMKDVNGKIITHDDVLRDVCQTKSSNHVKRSAVDNTDQPSKRQRVLDQLEGDSTEDQKHQKEDLDGVVKGKSSKHTKKTRLQPRRLCSADSKNLENDLSSSEDMESVYSDGMASGSEPCDDQLDENISEERTVSPQRREEETPVTSPRCLRARPRRSAVSKRIVSSSETSDSNDQDTGADDSLPPARSFMDYSPMPCAENTEDSDGSLLQKLGLSVNTIELYCNATDRKMPINKDMINRHEKGRPKVSLRAMLKERSHLEGFAREAFDLLPFEPNNITGSGNNRERYLTNQELLVLQNICVLNPEAPDVEMFYQILIQVLLARRQVLLMPNSLALLLVAERVRKEFNRAKRKGNHYEYLAQDWDPTKIYTTEDFWLAEKKPPRVPTVRTVLSIFCLWKNLEKRVPISLPIALEELCRNLVLWDVDKIGICVKLYSRYCSFLYEEKNENLAVFFLNQPFLGSKTPLKKNKLLACMSGRDGSVTGSVVSRRKMNVTENDVQAVLKQCLEAEQTVLLSPGPKEEENFRKCVEALKHKVNSYKKEIQLIQKITKETEKNKFQLLSKFTDPQFEDLTRDLNKTTETLYRLLAKKTTKFEMLKEVECMAARDNNKVCKLSPLVLQAAEVGEEVSDSIKELVYELLLNEVKVEEVRPALCTIVDTLTNRTQAIVPSSSWIRNFARITGFKVNSLHM